MSNIDKWMAGLNAKKSSPRTYNGAVSKIAPKAIKGGTAMPANANFGARMASARKAKGTLPKTVSVKPLTKGKMSRPKKGSKPSAVTPPSLPSMPLPNTATNTTAGNPQGNQGALHLHVHLDRGGY